MRIFDVGNNSSTPTIVADTHGEETLTLTANVYEQLEIGQTVYKNVGFTIDTDTITANSRNSYAIVFEIVGTAPAQSNYTIKIAGKEFHFPIANGEDLDEYISYVKIAITDEDIEIFLKADNAQSFTVAYNLIIR